MLRSWQIPMGRLGVALFSVAILFAVTQNLRARTRNDNDRLRTLTTRFGDRDDDAVRGRNHEHSGPAKHDHSGFTDRDQHHAKHDSAAVHDHQHSSGSDYDSSPFVPLSSPRISATEVNEVGFFTALVFGACIHLAFRYRTKNLTGASVRRIAKRTS